MSSPKIVFFDLETLPNLPEALKVWTQLGNFPGRTLRATISTIICFGYSVLDEGEVRCLSAWDWPAWQSNVNDDRVLCETAYELLKDADAVVTHNGKRFDWKFLQTRLVYHGFPPLPKIHHIDTKALASSNLFFFSNKLDLLAENLGLQRKLDHEGWELWVRVHGRDPEAMRLMSEYCAQDVVVLKEIFKKLRPFATNLPNHNLFTVGGNGQNLCPSCGSTRLRSDGLRSNKTMTYRRYRCLDCGSPSRTNIQDRMPRSI